MRLAVEQPQGALVPSELIDAAAVAALHGDIDVERGDGERVWLQFPEFA